MRLGVPSLLCSVVHTFLDSASNLQDSANSNAQPESLRIAIDLLVRAGWRADLRFLAGSEDEERKDLRARQGQGWPLPSSHVGYHFVTMNFEDTSGQETWAKQADGSEMKHPCGSDTYTGSAQLLSDRAFSQVDPEPAGAPVMHCKF